MTPLRSLSRMVGGSPRLLVLLPGYGDRPERFIARVDDLDPSNQWSVVVLEPRLPRETGPYWYDVDADGPLTSELDGSVDAVRRELAALSSLTGIDAASMVLVGFSQGGALAMALLLDPDHDPAPAAVAVLAGYLPHRADSAVDLTRAEGRPVLLAHGRDDELIEPLRGRSAARALQRAGAAVTWVETEGGHRFDDPLIAPLRAWLAALARDEIPSAPI